MFDNSFPPQKIEIGDYIFVKNYIYTWKIPNYSIVKIENLIESKITIEIQGENISVGCFRQKKDFQSSHENIIYKLPKSFSHGTWDYLFRKNSFESLAEDLKIVQKTHENLSQGEFFFRDGGEFLQLKNNRISRYFYNSDTITVENTESAFERYFRLILKGDFVHVNSEFIGKNPKLKYPDSVEKKFPEIFFPEKEVPSAIKYNTAGKYFQGSPIRIKWDSELSPEQEKELRAQMEQTLEDPDYAIYNNIPPLYITEGEIPMNITEGISLEYNNQLPLENKLYVDDIKFKSFSKRKQNTDFNFYDIALSALGVFLIHRDHKFRLNPQEPKLIK